LHKHADRHPAGKPPVGEYAVYERVFTLHADPDEVAARVDLEQEQPLAGVEADPVDRALVLGQAVRAQPPVYLHPARLADALDLEQPLAARADQHLHVQTVVHLRHVALARAHLLDLHAVRADQSAVLLDRLDLHAHVVVADQDVPAARRDREVPEFAVLVVNCVEAFIEVSRS